MSTWLHLTCRDGRIPHLELRSEECPVILGRSMSSDRVVPCSLVSRQHARLQFDGADFLLIDLESTNGTLVNSKPLHQPTAIHGGDTVQIGDCLYDVSHGDLPTERPINSTSA